MARRIAYLTEELDHELSEAQWALAAGTSHDSDTWLLGSFTASAGERADSDRLDDPVPLADAVAWALERADAIVLRIGLGDHYAIGETGDELPPWDPALATTLVRRRPEHEAWKDRTDADAPIRWTVEAALAPAFEHSGRVLSDADALDAEAEALIAAWAPLRWSDADVSAFRAAVAAQLAEHGEEEGGWFVGGGARWLLTFETVAPTRERAVEQALAPATAPPAWTIAAVARPAA